MCLENYGLYIGYLLGVGNQGIVHGQRGAFKLRFNPLNFHYYRFVNKCLSLLCSNLGSVCFYFNWSTHYRAGLPQYLHQYLYQNQNELYCLRFYKQGMCFCDIGAKILNIKHEQYMCNNECKWRTTNLVLPPEVSDVWYSLNIWPASEIFSLVWVFPLNTGHLVDVASAQQCVYFLMSPPTPDTANVGGKVFCQCWSDSRTIHELAGELVPFWLMWHIHRPPGTNRRPFDLVIFTTPDL